MNYSAHWIYKENQMSIGHKLHCFFLAALILAAGCSQDASLYYANESTGMMATYPESELTYNTGLAKWSYQSEGLHVHLSVSGGDEDQLAIKLVNPTDHAMKVLWSRSGFRDRQGRRWRLVHEGVAFWSPASAVTPGSVPAHGHITDVIMPARPVERDGAIRLAPLSNQQIISGFEGPVALLLAVEGHTGVRIYTLRFDPADLEDDGPLFNPMD